MLFRCRFPQRPIVTRVKITHFRKIQRAVTGGELSQIDQLFVISHHIKLLIYSFQLKLVLDQSPDAVKGRSVNINSRKTYETDAILAATSIPKIQNAASLSTAAIFSHV